MRVITILLISTFYIACNNSQPSSKSLPNEPTSPGEIEEYIKKADSVANLLLSEFNESAVAKEFEGPFKLEEYRRDVRIEVNYNLERPVGFFGHPEHFSISVPKDSGEIRVFRGR